MSSLISGDKPLKVACVGGGQLGRMMALEAPSLQIEMKFLDPGGAPLSTAAPEPLTLVIGPEGGWSDAERTAASGREGLEVTGLGPLTLRAETAPLAVLAAVRQCWGWQR